MKTKIFAGLISSFLLTCMWVEQSAVATAAGSWLEGAVPVAAAKKADMAETSFLHVLNAANSSEPKDEMPILLLNLSLDKELPKK